MKKLENFYAALENLRDIYAYAPPYDNVTTAGLVALFEICFEQAWKAMKATLEREGIPESSTGSPRQVLKAAYRAGLIREEDIWLDALASRNNVAHAYNKAVALDLIEAAKQRYFGMFGALKQEMEKRWME